VVGEEHHQWFWNGAPPLATAGRVAHLEEAGEDNAKTRHDAQAVVEDEVPRDERLAPLGQVEPLRVPGDVDLDAQQSGRADDGDELQQRTRHPGNSCDSRCVGVSVHDQIRSAAGRSPVVRQANAPAWVDRCSPRQSCRARCAAPVAAPSASVLVECGT